MSRLVNPPTILYVEDNPDDVFLLRRSLQLASLACNVETVSDIFAAKSYLSGKTPYDDRERFPLPNLLITDVSVPSAGESGLQLVEWVHRQPGFAGLKIFCSTGGDDPAPRAAFAKLGVRCFTKTTRFVELIAAIEEALV